MAVLRMQSYRTGRRLGATQQIAEDITRQRTDSPRSLPQMATVPDWGNLEE